MSIFISIASYRDPETIPTIIDAYNKASNKKDIRFGVALQEDANFSNKNILPKSINIDFIEYDWRESQGTCWARNCIQKLLFNNEDFYLQLDSHHRFCENWDKTLMNLFAELSLKQDSKPIIGGYCPGYSPSSSFLEDKPMRISSFPEFSSLGDLMFSPKVIKDFKKLREDNITNIPARFLSGHFIFTIGDFVKECPYDPNMYFRGEELTLSARAFTNNYDFFHPLQSIIWHEYLRLNQTKHWDDHTKENGFVITSSNRDIVAKQRARQLLGMEKNMTQFGKYGLGNSRSLHDYELFAGLNFSQKLVHKYAYDINDDAPYPHTMTEENWKTGMMNKYIVEFDMPSNYINSILEQEANSLAFICYNNKNKTIYRKDIQKKDFQNFNTNTVKLASNMLDRPHRLTIFPFKKDKKTLKPENILFIRTLNEQ